MKNSGTTTGFDQSALVKNQGIISAGHNLAVSAGAQTTKQTQVVALNSLISKIKKMSALAIAIWLSFAVHAAILTIKFAPPELKKLRDNMPSLEVMLVNAKTKKASEHADVLAQANLDRGGNTDENHKLKTALPAPVQKMTEVTVKASQSTKAAAASAQKQAQETREQKSPTELDTQAQTLLTQIRGKHKVDSPPTQQAISAQADKGSQQAASKSLDAASLAAQALEIDRLEALIAKQQDEFQKRPKRKFIGARTQEYRFALYVEAWRQKIEKIGNLNYPKAAKDNKLYGQLRLTVSIKADGSLEGIEINKSSGSKVLDEAARHIVELAAPYASFPDDIRKDTDILSVTRTWTFTQDDNLATE